MHCIQTNTNTNLAHTHKRRTYVIVVQCLRLCFFSFSIYLSSLVLRSVVFLFLRILLIHFDFFSSFFSVGRFVCLLRQWISFIFVNSVFLILEVFFSSRFYFFLFLFFVPFRVRAAITPNVCVREWISAFPYVPVRWMHRIYFALFHIHNDICIHAKFNISRRMRERKSKTIKWERKPKIWRRSREVYTRDGINRKRTF